MFGSFLQRAGLLRSPRHWRPPLQNSCTGRRNHAQARGIRDIKGSCIAKHFSGGEVFKSIFPTSRQGREGASKRNKLQGTSGKHRDCCRVSTEIGVCPQTLERQEARCVLTLTLSAANNTVLDHFLTFSEATLSHPALSHNLLDALITLNRFCVCRPVHIPDDGTRRHPHEHSEPGSPR